MAYYAGKGAQAAEQQPKRRSAPANTAEPPRSVASHIADTIEQLQLIDARESEKVSTAHRVADVVTRRSGSLWFIFFHVVWFGTWIALNVPDWGLRFDPFPFGLLTTIVSLEAIMLSVFILMSENRQAERDERHAKVDLEVNLIAEREVTKVISLLAAIHEHLGIRVDDEEVAEMNEPTRVQDLVEAVDADVETPTPGVNHH